MEVDQLKDLIKLRFKGHSSRKISSEINVSESHVDRALAFLSYHGPLVLLTHPSLRDNSRPLTSVDYNLMAEYAIKNQLSYDRTSSLFMASRKIVTRYIQGRKLMDYPFSDQDPPFPPNVSLDRAYDPMHPNFRPELIKAIEDTLIHEFGFTHEDLIPVIKPISARAQKRAEAAAKEAAAAEAAAAASAATASAAAEASSESVTSEPLDSGTSDEDISADAYDSESHAENDMQQTAADESEHADTEDTFEPGAPTEVDDDFDLDTIPIFAAASSYPSDLVAVIEAAPQEPECTKSSDDAEHPASESEQPAETAAAEAASTADADSNESEPQAEESVSMDGLKDFKLSEGKGQTTLFDLDM